MRILFTAAFASLAFSAWASPYCTKEPESAWLSEAVVRERAVATGNSVEVFKKTKGNCYEVYGRNAKGKRVEIYYHPVTGEIVEEH
ncbi:PepSY domain-containing protein [Rhizobium sp. 42MFCr.1]|uniref:PepSY domain-containing protein n=1 Tax=Rhizobium sp. 42MFCr.1 TaxID=1048680 RepID=UPI00037F006A|nr:PepSY domain-containing protein [Rhizobium sp. 42MFCr.1]